MLLCHLSCLSSDFVTKNAYAVFLSASAEGKEPAALMRCAAAINDHTTSWVPGFTPSLTQRDPGIDLADPTVYACFQA